MPRPRALAELLVAVACLTVAAVVVGTWIDDGDATCTALYRLDRTSYWFTRGCRSTMLGRLAVVLALAAVSTALLVDLVRTWRASRRS